MCFSFPGPWGGSHNLGHTFFNYSCIGSRIGCPMDEAHFSLRAFSTFKGETANFSRMGPHFSSCCWSWSRPLSSNKRRRPCKNTHTKKTCATQSYAHAMRSKIRTGFGKVSRPRLCDIEFSSGISSRDLGGKLLPDPVQIVSDYPLV